MLQRKKDVKGQTSEKGKVKFIGQHYIQGVIRMKMNNRSIKSVTKKGIPISNTVKYKEQANGNNIMKMPVFYKIPLSCGSAYIGEIKRGLETGNKEHCTNIKKQKKKKTRCWYDM